MKYSVVKVESVSLWKLGYFAMRSIIGTRFALIFGPAPHPLLPICIIPLVFSRDLPGTQGLPKRKYRSHAPNHPSRNRLEEAEKRTHSFLVRPVKLEKPKRQIFKSVSCYNPSEILMKAASYLLRFFGLASRLWCLAWKLLAAGRPCCVMKEGHWLCFRLLY